MASAATSPTFLARAQAFPAASRSCSLVVASLASHPRSVVSSQGRLSHLGRRSERCSSTSGHSALAQRQWLAPLTSASWPLFGTLADVRTPSFTHTPKRLGCSPRLCRHPSLLAAPSPFSLTHHVVFPPPLLLHTPFPLPLPLAEPAYSGGQQQYLADGALYLLFVPAHLAVDDAAGVETDETLMRWLATLQARAPEAVVQLVLSHADRLVGDQYALAAAAVDEAQTSEERQERLEALQALLDPKALERAAAPQLDWIRSKVNLHNERRATAIARRRGSSEAPRPTLRVQENIACVCAAPGGERTLVALRSLLEALAKPPLLPSAGYVIPRSWVPAMAFPLALRDGKEPLAAARHALATVTDPAPVAGSSTDLPAPAAPAAVLEARLPYVHASDLCEYLHEEIWPVLLPEEPERGGQLLKIKSALELLENQGEIFTSNGLIFLDPAFTTQLLKPLVDHRLTRSAQELTGERRAADAARAAKAKQRKAAERYVHATLGAGADHRALGRLLEALNIYECEGVLSEAALAFLWHGTRLQAAHYRDAARMLCESGVFLELPHEPNMLLSTLLPGILGPAPEERRRYAMPMRLPEERPASVDASWPRDVLEPGQTQLGVRFDFFGLSLPPGTIERCVAGCATGAKLRACWRHGALIEGRASALLQRAVDADGCACIDVEVRGDAAAPALWGRLMALVAKIESVVKEMYQGVQYDLRLVCPGCRAEGRWGEAPAAFSWHLDEPNEAAADTTRERASFLQRACERWPSNGRGMHATEATSLECARCRRAVELRPSHAERARIAERGSPLATIGAGSVLEQLQVLAPAPLPPPRSGLATIPPRPRKFAAFLSHDWGIDELGRSNHERVGKVAAELEARGLHVWLDDNEMHGDVNKRMADGIEDSACVVAFVTQRYLVKAGGEGPNGADDNVKFEFDHALRRRGVRRMITVLMEPSCRDPRDWCGVVGGKLGGLLYADLSTDDRWNDGLDHLAKDIQTVIEGENVVLTKPPPTPPAAEAAHAPAAAPVPSQQGLHSRSSSKKLFVATTSDAQEEEALKRGAAAAASSKGASAASVDERATTLGLVGVFKAAGVTLTADIRDAALRFCDGQQVGSLAEVVEYETVDDFMKVLEVPMHPERKLRRALEGHYMASVPWHQRVWRWVKGAAKEVNEVPGVTAFLGQSVK